MDKLEPELRLIEDRQAICLKEVLTAPGSGRLNAVGDIMIVQRLLDGREHPTVKALLARAVKILAMMQLEAELAEGRTNFADLMPAGGVC